MPTYLYETIASSETVRRFELRQHFDEPALTTDPETGEPVRRVVSGGMGFLAKGSGATAASEPACGPESCRCGRFG